MTSVTPGSVRRIRFCIGLVMLSLAATAWAGGASEPADQPVGSGGNARETTGAGAALTSNITSGAVENYDPAVDYFPEKVTIEEATDFEIRYENNYKVLTVRTDLKFPGMAPQVVVMVQRGTPAPELTGDLSGATLVEVPVTTFGLTRNDDLASAVALGLTDTLVSHGFGGVFPAEIQARIDSGDISVGGGAFGLETADFETIAARRPDVMLALLGNEAGLAGISRLAELGIPTIPTLTSVSTTVLGRAEWAKVIALPFNQEARANVVLGDVLERYRELSARAVAQPDKPTAIFAQCGTNGECTVAVNGWQAQIMEDAGLVNILADPTARPGLERMSIERVFELGAAADWILAFSFPGPKYTGPLMQEFRAFQLNQIIANDAEGVSRRDNVYEYFYSGALRPDLLLQDIVAQVYPDLVPSHTVTYMGISPFPGQ